MRWFSLAMSAIYLVAGAAIALTNVALDLIPRWRTALGAVLIGYGIVRMLLWYRKDRRQRESGDPS